MPCKEGKKSGGKRLRGGGGGALLKIFAGGKGNPFWVSDRVGFQSKRIRWGKGKNITNPKEKKKKKSQKNVFLGGPLKFEVEGEKTKKARKGPTSLP